jgi:hypothetical protein
LKAVREVGGVKDDRHGMLLMRNTGRGNEAEQAIKAAALGLIDNSVVDHIAVTSDEDSTGEPTFFVNVYLRDRRDRPSAAKSIEIIKAMRDALLELGDDRFPHLSFSAPNDEAAEDTRPAE